jgi:flavin-binding protein dodecin
MENQTYKIVEIAGSSSESITGAIKSGLATADESLRQLRWFEVKQIRGHIADGKVGHFQVVMKVGFAIEGE